MPVPVRSRFRSVLVCLALALILRIGMGASGTEGRALAQVPVEEVQPTGGATAPSPAPPLPLDAPPAAPPPRPEPHAPASAGIPGPDPSGAGLPEGGGPPAAPPPAASPWPLAPASPTGVSPNGGVPGDAAVSPDFAAAPPPAARAASAIAPTLNGPVGLLRTSSAEVGPLYQLRAGLRGEYFSADGFLIDGDSNQKLAGGLTVGFTLRPDLELFAALLNSSNRNHRLREVADRDPELIKTFGDLVLGGKWILPLGTGMTLGAELGLKFLSGVSDLSISPSSTSWWLGPLFTADLRRLAGVPVRLHANASYYADNSRNLYDLSGLTRNTKEVAMFAYGIYPSRLRLALAVDLPLGDVLPAVPLDPFIEYHAAYVTADADADFRDYMAPNCGGQSGQMPCVDNRDMQSVTIGARANVYRGITVDLGVDLRIRSPGFPYGPPVAPWNLVFGVSYPLDIDVLTRPVIITRTVAGPPALPAEGNLTGAVRNARDGAPIAGAVVVALGRPRARAATDPDGGFMTANLPAGPAELEITAANFDTARVTAVVVAGASVDVPVILTPHPPVGQVHGKVTGPAGQGLEATLRLAGDEVRDVRSDATGSYSVSVPVGAYRVRVEAPGLAPREAQVEVVAGQDQELNFNFRPPAANPNVVLAAKAIRLRQPVRFVGASAQLQPASQALLNGVADLLAAHGEIGRVRIEAHWDSSVSKAQAAELTQQQAEAVRAYLIGRGVAASRLTAVGVGTNKPLVPNLTPMARARNRRIELHLE
jgi:outer membrane protein OmpA-like peptidoglycan-associated protein